jgi:hypothetical protein
MVINRGRLINFISGINGVSAGGNAIVNLPCNRRMHKLLFQCAGINYTGGTALATTALTGGGNDDATVTPTIVNGVPTSIAVVAGGTGYTTGDTITFTDATGTGFVGTVTAAAGAVTAVAVTVAGTASPMDPATFFSAIRLLVNGVNMRDIAPVDILKIAMSNGLFPRRGELPIYFTPPWRNVNQANEITSWDLVGQSTFAVQFTIAGTVSLPSLVGIEEFDYARNLMPDGKPFLQPTAQHSFGFPIVAGRNDINTLPIDFPISRMWIQGSTPGEISQVELFQDGNKPLEATIDQLRQDYEGQGFQFGQANYINAGWSGTNALRSQYAQPRYYDAAFIADPDQRWGKALSVEKSMILRVYSDVAQQLTVTMETLPGAFA